MNKIITCTAPVNIAVIKYWGKRDEELVLPLNDSISVTLSQDEMCAKTTVMVSPDFTEDRLWLNGKEENVSNPRIVNCLKEVRRRAKISRSDSKLPSDDQINPDWRVYICSENNFPTAAGLASSAAGYACLVFSLAKVFGVDGNLSTIARLGSGSACRSMDGGFVRWYKGELGDGSDSYASQIASESHWKDLRVIICVAGKDKKKTSSTEGMRRSVQTSNVLKFRTTNSVVQRTEQMTEALRDKDWSTFCDLTMRDSNEMHAACLDSFPPLIYMNSSSHAVAEFVHEYNGIVESMGKPSLKVCYTFDAGPNACLLLPGEVFDDFKRLLLSSFVVPGNEETLTDGAVSAFAEDEMEMLNNLVSNHRTIQHTIDRFIFTKIGDGPRVLPDHDSVHLIDRQTGLPVKSSI